MKLRLASLLIVLVGFGSFAPSASARPAGPPPPYVECSSTVWATKGAGNGPYLRNGVNITVYLRALVDARDGAYCDSMQGWTHFAETSGTCNAVIEVQVTSDVGGSFLLHDTTAGGCGASGDAFSNVGNPVVTVGCGHVYYGQGWEYHDSNDYILSRNYTPC